MPIPLGFRKYEIDTPLNGTLLLQNESIRQIIKISFIEGLQPFDLCWFWWHLVSYPHVIRCDKPQDTPPSR